VTLAEVLDAAGRRDEAQTAMHVGLTFYDRKRDHTGSNEAKRRLPHLA
jgi:hypothetical protein